MKLITSLFALLYMLALTGCNTVEGVGEDVEAAGDAVGDFARETEEELED